MHSMGFWLEIKITETRYVDMESLENMDFENLTDDEVLEFFDAFQEDTLEYTDDISVTTCNIKKDVDTPVDTIYYPDLLNQYQDRYDELCQKRLEKWQLTDMRNDIQEIKI